MPLSRTLARQVPPTIRARGESYFFKQAVREIAAEAGIIHATVRGSEDYDVWLEPHGRRLHVACTCRYFLDHFDVCKHIWAALLAAEARSLPLAPSGVALDRLEIDPVDPDDEADRRFEAGARDAHEDEAGDEDDDVWADDERGVWTPERALLDQRAARGGGVQPWRQLLHGVSLAAPATLRLAPPHAATGERLYVIDVPASLSGGGVVVDLMTRVRKANGDWRAPKPARLRLEDIRSMPNEDERQTLERLCGADLEDAWTGWNGFGREIRRIRLRGPLLAEALPRLCATGRCLLRRDGGVAGRLGESSLAPLAWDEGEPWVFTVAIQAGKAEGAWRVDGAFVRGDERLSLSAPLLVTADGILITETQAARLDAGEGFSWLATLRRTGPVTIPASARHQLMDALLVPGPRIDDVPPALRVEIVAGRPAPRLRLRPMASSPDRLAAEILFEYDDTVVTAATSGPIVRTADPQRAVRRDLEAEQAALETLPTLGFRNRFDPQAGASVLQLAAKRLPAVVRDLLDRGWQVEGAGHGYRRPGTTTLAVRSGIDWFELDGSVEYDDQSATLPQLLAALNRGEPFVKLADGTLGLLPEEWLRRQQAVAALGTRDGDHVRFRTSQAALLDALVAAQPHVGCDETFARVRRELKAFEGVRAADAPAGFTGTLRGYQREGLGWLLFLQRFGFGGCLADDMGLGKTVMVLALLATRGRRRGGTAVRRPSLVVAPRSLIFNWREEAARFTPALKVLEYTGTGRHARREAFDAHDVVLTTYGTLRRDAAALAAIPFDYLVLDEAQAVKNAASLSAKSARTLRAEHRLALSGTPVENHLGELWSLFEFLNPGLLGSAAAFERARAGSRMGEDEMALLARGLRPFILRRTKGQVAPELPARSEQTIVCELEGRQRTLYNELRAHYRATLLGGSDADGFRRRKLQVLEALLRLRQAACHPGLVDRRRLSDESAKLDVLVPRVTEAVQEGHKALVFSQFTSLLAILRRRLDADG
ncbi:MAG: helicase SNF2, partial [Acidobacteriota bacterium]|nr:helicase SNF2 [Acidobacteriota bacterium]